MTIPEPVSVQPDGTTSGAAGVPAAPGIYRLTPHSGEPHISSSVNLRRRTERLLKTFAQGMASLDCWPTSSKLDTSLLLYALSKQAFPATYARRLRIKPPWFLHLTDLGNFPQLAISNRIPAESPCVLGPFASRDFAQAFTEKVLGLFQLRRCPGVLHPSPDHPGCIYGEMNLCLRPCQCAVSPTEYTSEVARVLEFLAARPSKLTGTVALARERASENLQFEEAAYLHKRLERIKAALALREDYVGDIRSFSGVAVTPAYGEGTCYMRPMRNGLWQSPVLISFAHANGGGDTSDAPRSIDAEVRRQLQPIFAEPETTGEPSDHLALFQRWYGSSWRVGEWVSVTPAGVPDYARLVRRMSKLITSSC